MISFVKVVHQLIERKQAEIRKVHPGLSGFSDTVKRIDIKDIPGICKYRCSACLFMSNYILTWILSGCTHDVI